MTRLIALTACFITGFLAGTGSFANMAQPALAQPITPQTETFTPENRSSENQSSPSSLPDSRASSNQLEGFQIEISSPLSTRQVQRTLGQLRRLAQARRDDRVTVVLRFAGSANNSSLPEESNRAPANLGDSRSDTSLEDALKLARAISGDELRRIRCIAWIDGPVTGHETLVALACESMVASRTGSLGEVTSASGSIDETTSLIYQSIAKRRGLLPDAVVASLVNPNAELARVRSSDGEVQFVIGQKLAKLRQSGDVVEETTWAETGVPLVLSADQLRQLRAATTIVSSPDEVADHLGLARLRNESVDSTEQAIGVLLKVNGPINAKRVRRWQANLAATVDSGETNTWMIEIDSPGGYLPGTASLAAVAAEPASSIRQVGGFVSHEARGDAVLLALACQPLSLHPEATLGGPGAQAIDAADVDRQRELITLIADSTGRSETLIRGLLNPELAVHRYIHRRTGRIRYAVPSELTAEFNAASAKNADGDSDAKPDVSSVWKREQRIELGDGLSSQAAIELGLAEAEAENLSVACTTIGLDAIPPQLSDRGLVRWVEQIGRNDGMAFALLLMGFMFLSAEASAPGLGIPGFLAMLCFAFFFWTKFLAGTAEWAELLAFGLGIACLAIEVFVLPGFGIFGVGGLVLTVLGVVLMSQTFVVPRNAYQTAEAVNGIGMAMGAMIGLIVGLFLVRAFLPKAATATGLAMEVPSDSIEEGERVAHYDHLLGQTGVAATRLRPSGKARFGDTLVSVISDGSAVEPGQPVRVLQVLGNRIVVETVEP
ncbi:NfeD-like C-terminal, partner-binding [Neorhodopirellula lusitana]|uniref:NfeD-like C-terminal, partner-binding n=1 Tax=Neorhodopirellula lusitana TaxID=445327 RepID=A0ABY1QA63_9BACT|nr:NfeD family protein [Neorhodopirellula lusitana]SMP65345.1 NfeD-like C-terminal, partner-binding [Neorhodopirellula lusitana]